MSMMVSLGANHETLDLNFREKLAVAPEKIPVLINELRQQGADEAVIISTCNRIEIYLAGENLDQAQRWLLDQWTQLIGSDMVTAGVIRREQEFCARHLFRVASGLNSLVLGETQILGQIKTAYSMSLSCGATGNMLNPLFQQALHVGKFVRSHTTIASGITSVASAAVMLAEKIFGQLNHCRVLVLGAGQMAHATLKHMSSKKTNSIKVANRTYEKAAILAKETNVTATPWSEALHRLDQADIIICSTSSNEPIITAPLIKNSLRTRQGKPIFLIDIAVPRNVEEQAIGLEGVYYYSVDDLKNLVTQYAQTKSAEAVKAEAIIKTKALDYFQRRKILPTSPLVANNFPAINYNTQSV